MAKFVRVARSVKRVHQFGRLNELRSLMTTENELIAHVNQRKRDCSGPAVWGLVLV